MTVVAGYVGRDGAVIASDSQASEVDHTKYDVPKLWTERGLLLGYSGNTAVREPIAAALAERLKDFDTRANRWTVRARLCQITGAVLQGEYANYVPPPPAGQIPTALAGSLLVLGQDGDGYWLLDIDHSNAGTFHPERGFHAIGSGSTGAQVSRGVLEHYEPEARTVWHLQLIAYRTIQTCIRILDVGVGGAVQLWTLQDGTCTGVTGDALERVEHGVEQWTVIERESLDEVLGDQRPDPVEAGSATLPDDLGAAADEA